MELLSTRLEQRASESRTFVCAQGRKKGYLNVHQSWRSVEHEPGVVEQLLLLQEHGLISEMLVMRCQT